MWMEEFYIVHRPQVDVTNQTAFADLKRCGVCRLKRETAPRAPECV